MLYQSNTARFTARDGRLLVAAGGVCFRSSRLARRQYRLLYTVKSLPKCSLFILSTLLYTALWKMPGAVG